MRLPSLAAVVWITIAASATAQTPRVGFTQREDRLTITVDQQPVATYVFRDDQIRRPYFANVKAPGGLQVTRNHPPQQGDRDDHATMHPGIWLAFGDLGGADFWRNRATVEHVAFVQEPSANHSVGSFVERKRYVRTDDSQVCEERFHFVIHADADAYLLVFDSTFRSDREFDFGDQEEMGLGIRVATPITEVEGGRMSDSQDRHGAKQIWGNSADWCDYRGHVGDRPVGVTVLSHPANFRPSWFHARDYGLIVANPFGRSAMKKGEPSKVVIKPGETLRLRFAIWIHGGAGLDAIETAFREYVTLDAS